MTLEDWPNLSPNKKRFVVVASTADGECSPKYAVAVFSLASDPPRLEWQFTPTTQTRTIGLTDGMAIIACDCVRPSGPCWRNRNKWRPISS